MSNTKVLFAFAALTLFALPASAATVEVYALSPTLGGDTVAKKVMVRYDDLKPGDTNGAAALLDRITHTATQVCSSNPGGTTSLLGNAVAKCTTKAVKRAVHDIAVPELDRLAEAK